MDDTGTGYHWCYSIRSGIITQSDDGHLYEQDFDVGLIIAEFALVFGVTAAINRLSLATATMLFILYSVINGAMLSAIFVAYSPMVITKVFFITAGTFGAMAAYGYFTKRDLSSIGKILFMALIGLVIATVVNIFLKSNGFDLILSYLGVAIFTGLTAWDSQKIKVMLAQCEDMDEGAQKIALLGGPDIVSRLHQPVPVSAPHLRKKQQLSC
jgi:FtsH-binding integral membrane protein